MSCTLCGHIIDEYPLWGVDFPSSGPVHDECAELDYWHYSRDIQHHVLARHIRDHGWLPTPCATPRIWIY